MPIHIKSENQKNVKTEHQNKSYSLISETIVSDRFPNIKTQYFARAFYHMLYVRTYILNNEINFLAAYNKKIAHKLSTIRFNM